MTLCTNTKALLFVAADTQMEVLATGIEPVKATPPDISYEDDMFQQSNTEIFYQLLSNQEKYHPINSLVKQPQVSNNALNLNTGILFETLTF